MYTDKKYWENYYADSKVSQNQIITICSIYDKFWDILINSCNSQPKNILEVGAYPSRYLAYLAWKYTLTPTAIDINSDRETIVKSLQSMGIDNYNVICKDFTKWTSPSTYDLVISIGFIEHFDNYDDILDQHLKLLGKNGSILIRIPNKKGLRRLYGILCDKKNLNRYNLKCMKIDVFKKFAIRNNLDIHLLDYYGSFQYSVHQKLNIIQLIIYKIVRYFSLKYKNYMLDNPSWLYSAGIVGVFSKKR